MTLDGRAVLVTGVSRSGGIGAAVANRLAADGATKLFLTGWAPHDSGQPWGEDPGGGQGVAEVLRGDGVSVEFLSADFADPDAAQQVMAAATSAFGRVDALVANHARSSRQSLATLTAGELDASFAVNARATLLLMRHFVEQHDGSPGGRVVLFTSGQYHGAMPEELPYIASKAVVQQLTASLAVELAPRQITVNCVNPGPNDTGYATGELRRRVEHAMPAGRWGRPEDTARLVSWLLSDEADWVTGQTIASDGGWSARGSS
ncbi:3-ketoacyl-ACP reductase [Blastococcus sp. TF02-09]|uniref:SDR family oxidoreductase n=1 Tax=Blastococcus sp. TF02-09 TaxID=2250576 RepID=UPI000DE83EB6|nr:SDR family oxidoreductase [Blastococcus sp. TF02-9]RBY81105.1 3-ketoacyl-ACP reductase [Blastococcus sp. TF02-9]